MAELSHVAADGSARMVDVTGKPFHLRTALAAGVISLESSTVELVRQNSLKKGDVLTVAKIAGIQAAKRTSEWIPLCHPLPLGAIDLDFHLDLSAIRVEARVKSASQTGVEMEALTAVSAALLTIYDMCKAVDKTMVIGEIRLLQKMKEATA